MQYAECRCMCGQAGRLDEEVIRHRVGGIASVEAVMHLVPQLKCSVCGDHACMITDKRGRLLFDRANARRCSSCKEFIPLPRLEAIPQTGLCTECARAGEQELPAAPYPLPPREYAKCGRCGAATVMRQNSGDLSWFVGCSEFPKCHWSHNIE